MKYLSTKLFAIVIIAINGLSASGKDDDKMTLAEWAELSSENLQEYVNGTKMYRPQVAGDKLIISDMVEIPGADDEQVFLKALMYMREKIDPLTERIEAIDFKNHRFTVSVIKKKASDNNPVLFSYIEAFQGGNGLLSFSCSEMSVNFKEKGLIPRTLKFEKLNPQSNLRDRDWLESQALQFSGIVEDLVKYIRLRDNIRVEQQDNIEKGKLSQGMNADEVVLTIRQPFSKKKSGGRDKWLFEDGTSIIFTNGVVSHIMY